MAEAVDQDALAARYLDLWEKQLGASAAAPDLVRLLTAMLGGAGFAAPSGGAGDGSVGAEAAPVASGGGDGDLEQLARRLADVEARLAALEAGTRGRSEGTRGRARKRTE